MRSLCFLGHSRVWCIKSSRSSDPVGSCAFDAGHFITAVMPHGQDAVLAPDLYHEWIIFSTRSSVPGSLRFLNMSGSSSNAEEMDFPPVPSACLGALTQTAWYDRAQHGYTDSNSQLKSGCGLYQGNQARPIKCWDLVNYRFSKLKRITKIKYVSASVYIEIVWAERSNFVA